MSRTMGVLLSLLALAACARGAARPEGRPDGQSEAPLRLNPVTAGLREAHLAQAPLVEIVACIPPRERPASDTCNSSRVYRDGSYYLLQTSPEGERWAYLSSLKPEGVAELEQLLVASCDKTDPVHGNDQGSTLYRVTAPGCTRELVVTGLPAGGLAGLSRVPEIISRNLQKIPPAP